MEFASTVDGIPYGNLSCYTRYLEDVRRARDVATVVNNEQTTSANGMRASQDTSTGLLREIFGGYSF